MSDLFGNHIVGFPTRRLNDGIDQGVHPMPGGSVCIVHERLIHVDASI